MIGSSRVVLWFAVLCLAVVATAANAEDQRPTVAVLPFTLIDTSLAGQVYGPQSVESARLRGARTEVAERLAAKGRFHIININKTTQETRKVAGKQSLLDCSSCDTEIARRLGADYVIVGWVQKVSDLILNMNVAFFAVKKPSDVAAASVSIRGDTNESWARGARYLVDNVLLPKLARPTSPLH